MEQYIVTGMSCAACSSRVEKAVSKVPGVTSVSYTHLDVYKRQILHRSKAATCSKYYTEAASNSIVKQSRQRLKP